MTRTTPDLEVLGRSATQTAAKPPRRAGRLTLTLLVLGLLGAGLSLLWPLLNPPREVRMARVRPATTGEAAAAPRTTGAIEDVGWLEAYPFPVTVRPLVRGVLDSLHVLEGQHVKAGETLIGTMRNLELELAYARRKAAVDVAKAREAEALALLGEAKRLREQRAEPRHERATADGDVTVARRMLAALEAQASSADAAVAVAQVDLRAQQALDRSGGDTPVSVERARARVVEAGARAKAAHAEVEVARARLARFEAIAVVDREADDDPRALDAEVVRREQAHLVATAMWEDAEVERDLAKKLVDALRVVSPVDGIVMRLESAPGAVVGPEGEFKDGTEGGPGSTSRLNRMTGTMVSLYDPAQMQVRVDVLFARLEQIEVGGEVTFTVDAIPGKTFQGTVHRFVHEADINQNALQVKITVENPDEAMRPEMLCRVRFPGRTLGAPAIPGATPKPSVGQFLVPTEAVRDGVVYVFDPRGGGKARRVEVEVLGTQGEDSIVRGALGLSSQVILDAVEHDERVKEKA